MTTPRLVLQVNTGDGWSNLNWRNANDKERAELEALKSRWSMTYAPFQNAQFRIIEEKQLKREMKEQRK